MTFRTISGLAFSLLFASVPFVGLATTILPDDYGTTNTMTSSSYCPTLTNTFQRGAKDASTNGQVTELQEFLADYYDLNKSDVVSGFFGRNTLKYVLQFQTDQSLPIFGIIGSLTRAKIALVCTQSATVSTQNDTSSHSNSGHPTIVNIPGTGDTGVFYPSKTASITVSSTPSTGLAPGSNITIAWTSQNAPAGGMVYLYLIDSATGRLASNAVGSSLGTSGTFSWVVPTQVCITDVCGIFLKSGSYKILAQLVPKDFCVTIGNAPASACAGKSTQILATGVTSLITITAPDSSKPTTTFTSPITTTLFQNPITVTTWEAPIVTQTTNTCPVRFPPQCATNESLVSKGTDSAGCSLGSQCVAQATSATCTPFAPVTQTISCATGQTGSITQTRTSSCTAGATTPTWSAWADTSNTCVTPPPASCTQNGITVQSGASQTFYSSASVAFGGSCSALAQTRTCTNGTLSGTYQFASCSAGNASVCSFNGASVGHGASVTAYSSATVPAGSTCTSQSRTCSNGVLSGAYQFPSCTVSAPVCTPLSPQTQTVSCPTGQTGSITQTRTSSCTAGATTPTWSAWADTSNTCVTPPVVTPPPVITPPVTTTPKTVTADLTAGVENDITVNVGDTVHYVWNTTLPYPSILTTPDITTVCRTGVGKWFGYAGDANMKGTPSSGSEDMLVQSCDAGHTYNISYSVTNTYPAAPISTRYGSFNTSVRIHVNDAQGNLGSPTSSLTVNGQKEVTVNVGDTLSYAWTSTGAVSASNVVNAPSCAKFYNTPLPSGYADSLQGSKAFVVPSCEAGNEFYVTYTVTDANGRSSSSMVGVHVRMLPFSVLGSQAINGVFNTGPNALNIMANVDKASYKRGDYITVVWSNPIVKQDVYNPAPGQGINLFKVNMYVLNVATGQKILIGHNQHLSGVSVLQVGSDTQLSGTAPFNALGYNLPNIGNPFPTTGSYVIVADLVTNIQAHGAGEIFTPITSGQTQPFTISSLASNQSSINVANALSALQSMLESIRHFLGN